MQAFKLVSGITDKYSDLVGDFIGDGADGDVYQIKNDTTKVIKFSVHYLWNKEDSNKIIYNKLENFSLVKNNNIDLFANLYEYSYIGNGYRDIFGGGKQQYLLFVSVMEKCYKISEDENKVFHSILSHEDKNLNKMYPLDKIVKMLKGMSMGLDFSEEKVISFIKKIKKSKVIHTDIHPRNIMKDISGNFKFIDFDRVEKNSNLIKDL